MDEAEFEFVMLGLVPRIPVFDIYETAKSWMAGTSPAMTAENWLVLP
jgi:hypothetical protein